MRFIRRVWVSEADAWRKHALRAGFARIWDFGCLPEHDERSSPIADCFTSPPQTTTWASPTSHRLTSPAGSSPPHASAGLLVAGALCWDVAYILLVRRSLAAKSSGMPLLALAANVSWEIIYALMVAEHPLEQLGFLAWLLLDIPVVYATVRAARHDWAHAPLVARNYPAILGTMLAIGCAGNWAFARWWLEAPGRGTGDKTGKWWQGIEGIDCTELAFWTAGVAQLAVSSGSVALFLSRGHSGGASFGIWLSRALGTILGLIASSALLWFYWPEAHGYFTHPFAVFLMAICVGCDAAYPFVLARVRATERTLPDGRLVAGDECAGRNAAERTIRKARRD